MQTVNITIDRDRARDLYRAYKAHQHYSKPIDWEIQRTYQLIAQGKTVIRAIENITKSGVNADGLPKLALLPAHEQWCGADLFPNGALQMFPTKESRGAWPKVRRGHRDYFRWPAGTLPPRGGHRSAASAIPVIPLHLRPKRGLENYHVLWEATWQPVPPGDPYLLRRIGKADLWVVCAAWDLTPVEQAAMATRIAA